MYAKIDTDSEITARKENRNKFARVCDIILIIKCISNVIILSSIYACIYAASWLTVIH